MIFLYIDPGSGALIWQVLLAGFLGVAFYFNRIKSALFSRVRREKKDGETKSD